MRALFLTLIWISSYSSVHARTIAEAEIRPIQTDSTDVFEVLETLRQAQHALQNRDYQAARHGFESVLMHDPNLDAARAGLRQVFIAQGRIRDAQHLVTDESSVDAVIIRIRSGDVKTPIELLTATLKTHTDPRLWTLLGQQQDLAKNYAAARRSYNQADAAGARAGLAENNIGHSHWLAGEYELALAAFSKAVALAPLDTQFDNNRRRALIQLGRTYDAIEGLEAERAGVFLAQAADKAAQEQDLKLAQYLYRKSLDLAPRYNPRVAQKLDRLSQ